MKGNEDRIGLRAIPDALCVVGGKWRSPIIFALCDQPLRFNEMQRIVKDTTSRMLIKELREQEINDLVKLTVYDSSPLIVDYALTNRGTTLKPVLRSPGLWDKIHRDHIIQQTKTSY
ncbi:helix-turn-helix domain-containing protein [Spirosoma migulaei]